MSTQTPPVKTPIHLWIIAVVSLLWNLMGLFDFIMSQFMTSDYMAMMSEQEAAYFTALPMWIVLVWAAGVLTSVAGSVLLLMRNALALQAFVGSLAFMIVNLLHGFFLAKINLIAVAGTVALAFSAVIFVVAVMLVIYAARMKANGTLR